MSAKKLKPKATPQLENPEAGKGNGEYKQTLYGLVEDRPIVEEMKKCY